MIDRAKRMLKIGQQQFDVSHKISDTAKPLMDYRFEACDEFNAVQDKIVAIKESEKKRAKRLEMEELAAEQAKLNAPPPAPAEEGEGGEEGGEGAAAEGGAPPAEAQPAEAKPADAAPPPAAAPAAPADAPPADGGAPAS